MLRPELAAHIRHLTLTTPFKPIRPPKTKGLYRSNRKIIQQALTRAGLANVGDPETELRQADHRALIGLILAHAPRLVTLQLHVAKDDPYLDAILVHAVDRGQKKSDTPQAVAFQVLRTLYLASADAPPINLRARYRMRQISYACMKKDRPFIRLPRLRELQIINAQLEDDLAMIQPEENSLTELTITFKSPVQNIQPVLRYTTKLTQLSLAVNVPGSQIDLVMHEDLWKAILPFRDQLQYLDLHEPRRTMYSQGHPNSRLTPQSGAVADGRHVSFCCPLHQFTKLRQLCISPQLLLGHQCPHPSPTKFVSHLPPALESFALYCGHNYIERLSEEVLAIPQKKPRMPLNSILIDTQTWWSRDLPCESITGACRRNRIMLNTAGGDFLFYGGDRTHFADKTYDVIKSGEVHAADLAWKKARDIMPKGLTVQTHSGTLDENWV
ncbi:hypothetical protein BDW59DRAFT_151685 [Aspergillus cavernicola]|uniref:Uncharacterized protein n=1 Tax=Aspergillus cavernicola TaxID=176166 RepID=A0ABR4HWR6_9EURO